MPLIPRNIYYLAFVGVVFSFIPSYVQSYDPLRVLILNSYDESTMPYSVPRNTFMLELQKKYTSPIAFRQFDLRRQTGAEPGHEDLMLQLLQTEYAGTPPDLVVAVGPPATAFWLNQRDPAHWNSPFIAVGADFSLTELSFRSGDTAVITPFSFKDAVEDFLMLKPDTSHIVMVAGVSPHEQSLASLAKKQLESFSEQINFEYTNHMDLITLQNKLAGLKPGSAVFYMIFDSDVDGVLLSGYSGLAQVRSASPVPVFGVFDDQLGHGVLGGRLIQLEQMGIEMAETAQKVLENRPSDIMLRTVALGVPTYDWRELQAWGIDTERLLAGSVLLFKPQSIWKAHPGWTLLATAIITAQVLLIAYVLLQNRHRRKAEQASRRMSRLLVSAHEDERRYLARELHDDLSQRLARLSIDSAFASTHADCNECKETLQNLQPELIDISKYVHDMSYRLHPSLIDDLGLVAAIQSECERMRRYTDIEIREFYGEIDEQISDSVALCIYRIVQEAINNAVKYSNATTIELTLECEKRTVILGVRDNGVGFNTASAGSGSHLGLSSMRERAQWAGGSWKVHSKPGEGTTVRAMVPLEGTAE